MHNSVGFGTVGAMGGGSVAGGQGQGGSQEVMALSSGLRMMASPDVVTRRLDGELVLLNLLSENYFGLDEVGTRIWEVLLSSPTVQVGFDQLLSEYDVEAPRLRRDLEKLLSQLVEHGLIRLQAV
jgi:Coenzyme PQQ synthesis protein D (PqqD)